MVIAQVRVICLWTIISGWPIEPWKPISAMHSGALLIGRLFRCTALSPFVAQNSSHYHEYLHMHIFATYKSG